MMQKIHNKNHDLYAVWLCAAKGVFLWIYNRN